MDVKPVDVDNRMHPSEWIAIPFVRHH